MPISTKQRLEDIRARLAKYDKHHDDPYSFYPGEIPAVRELESNAPADIQFLLQEIEQL